MADCTNNVEITQPSTNDVEVVTELFEVEITPPGISEIEIVQLEAFELELEQPETFEAEVIGVPPQFSAASILGRLLFKIDGGLIYNSAGDLLVKAAP